MAYRHESMASLSHTEQLEPKDPVVELQDQVA